MYKVLLSAFLISMGIPSPLQAKKVKLIRDLTPIESENQHPSTKISAFEPQYKEIELAPGRFIGNGKPLYITTKTDRFEQHVYYSDDKGNKVKKYFGEGKVFKGETIHRGAAVKSLKALDKRYVKRNLEDRRINITKSSNIRTIDSLAQNERKAKNGYQLIRQLQPGEVDKKGRYILKPQYLEIFRYGDEYITSLSSKGSYYRFYSDEKGKIIRFDPQRQAAKRGTISRSNHPFTPLEILDKRYCELHPEKRALRFKKNR